MKRLLALMLAAWTLSCGCAAPAPDKTHDPLLTAQKELLDARQENERLQQSLRQKDEQIASLAALGDKRLDKLFTVHDIQLGSYTGGVDLDNKPGDDGVKVYLEPLDQQGSVIKAAGDVKIQLFDLAEKPPGNLIGEYEWPVDRIGQCWYSGMLSYYYAFVCPWMHGAPQHREIVLRVQFTDYLTGNIFVKQQIVKVELPPPSTQPSSSPTTQSK
jgi:hypothetical protein